MLVLKLQRASSRFSGYRVASPCLWGKLQNLSFSKVSKQVVMSILRGSRGTSWRVKSHVVIFCVTVAIVVLRRFQKMSCIVRGRRSTLDVSCCMFSWESQSQDCAKRWQSANSVAGMACCDMRWHSALYTLHSTFYTLHSARSTPYSTLYTSHSTLPHSTLYTLHSTLYTLHSKLHTRHFTLHTPHSTLYTCHSTLYTWHSTLYNPHFPLYTPHSTLATPHSTLHALHLTLYTPHSTLYTPHFILYTLHSTHYIPQHSTFFTPHTLHSTLFRIPQSTMHWHGNRGKMYKTVQ